MKKIVYDIGCGIILITCSFFLIAYYNLNLFSKFLDESIKKELKEETGRKAAIQNLIPTLKTIHNAYSQIDSPAARNALLKEVIDHVEYTKTKGGRWGRPDNFTIEIFPRVQ